MACFVYYDDQGNVERLSLANENATIGSAVDSQILLKDRSVSKRHASLIFEHQKFSIIDHESTNGTIVNGKPVKRQQLQNGDIIHLGSYKFFFDELYQTEEQLEKTFAKQIQDLKNSPTPKKQLHRPHRPHPVQKRPSPSSLKKTTPSNTQKKGATLPDTLAKVSMICGCLGPISFLPAIITGHMANAKTAVDKKNQTIGLALGYTFLFFWIIGLIYYFSQPSPAPKTSAASSPAESNTPSTSMEFPALTNPIELLKTTMVWMPPKGIFRHILFNDPSPAIDSNASLQKEVSSIRSAFIHGLVWVELNSLSFKVLPSQRKLQFTYENYRNNPTFWEYNSTVVPEKKTLYDPFFFPQETTQCFFNYDKTILPPIDRFSDPIFRWCFGVRGLLFDLPSHFSPQETLTNLRVILIVRSGTKASTLQIETLEGNLTREEPRSYQFKVMPAQLFAAIVYRVTDRKPVIISTQEKHFSLDDSKKLEAWIQGNLDEIISRQPATPLSVSSPFTITPKEEGTHPAHPKNEPPPTKTKVNFFFEPTKP
jgi:pSer/pThr/pTyr-binding forkhead associated (FHA) protein